MMLSLLDLYNLFGIQAVLSYLFLGKCIEVKFGNYQLYKVKQPCLCVKMCVYYVPN